METQGSTVSVLWSQTKILCSVVLQKPARVVRLLPIYQVKNWMGNEAPRRTFFWLLLGN